jgi:hypothetical protein
MAKNWSRAARVSTRSASFDHRSGTAGQDDLLLRWLFLKPAQTITEALMLGDHRPYLLEHIDQRILMAQHDGRQHADILAHCFLIRAHSSQFGEQPFELCA